MPTSHSFHLSSLKPQILRKGGSRIDVRADSFSALKDFSLSLLTLEPNAVREPHWHPNASELSYCLEGQGLMTLFGPHNDHQTISIQAGEVIFVPKNSLHHIENTGPTVLKLLISFDSALADSSEMSSGFQAISPTVLASVLQCPASLLSPLQKEKEPVYICLQSSPAQRALFSTPNPFKFDLEGCLPTLQTDGGWVKIANQYTLPHLKGLAAFSLNLKNKGIREPHWHPNCHELNYVLCGQVKITLMFPGGSFETFELSAGDISFLPAGYLHDIENIGAEDARLIVFFNHELPEDIGFSGAFGAYSNQTLAAIFGLKENYFDDFTKFQTNRMIVPGGG